MRARWWAIWRRRVRALTADADGNDYVPRSVRRVHRENRLVLDM
jgi:hypothetical protein